MRTLIKLAWRNIWRNKRRTIITSASILFAVLLSAFMVSIQKGAWDRMVDNVVNFYFGYIQIHSKGYWEEQSIDKAFVLKDPIAQLAGEIEGLRTFVPRLESFALAAYKENTTGALVVGSDPVVENGMTNLGDRVVKGEFIKQGEAAALVAEGVAENLDIGPGDTLVLISQGYHGVNAAGKYPVKGIVKFGSPELNKQMIFLPLETAQQFYGAPDMLTSVAVKVESMEDVEPVLKALQSRLDTMTTYEVMSWQELMPELVEAREVDTAGNYIVLIVLYVIITFGIFGTILMMTKEREYEFGILLSIGMKRFSIGFMIWLEVVFLGLVGAVAGILLSLPLVGYFNRNPVNFGEISEQMKQAYEKFGFEPIFPAAFDWQIFFMQAFIVIIITTILAAYPMWKISRLKPVEAMRA